MCYLYQSSTLTLLLQYLIKVVWELGVEMLAFALMLIKCLLGCQILEKLFYEICKTFNKLRERKKKISVTKFSKLQIFEMQFKQGQHLLLILELKILLRTHLAEIITEPKKLTWNTK